MRLTLFLTYNVSLKIWAETGLLQREIRLYQILQRQGVMVQLLTYGDASDREFEGELEGIGLLPIYERIRRPRSRVLQLLQSFLVPWVLRHEIRCSDIFKTNQMMGAWVAVVAKFCCRKPLLLRCGYELSEFLRLRQATGWQRCAGWLVSFVSYHLADRIHVATRSDAALVHRRFGVPMGRIVVRPNWIDTHAFTTPRLGDQPRHGVLFVGRFSKQKNLPLLLEAISDTGQVLTLVGGGEDERVVRASAQALGVRVDFRGRIANNLLPALYRRCAVYVICSHYEGHPKTLLEAMACGCAVVGTDVPGIHEIVAHEHNGLLTAENPAALRATLRRLLIDKELRKQLGGAAREWVIQAHSLDSAVAAEWQTYNELSGSASDGTT
jgi:glycosyltransferase involved in cell wall biosynthesis